VNQQDEVVTLNLSPEQGPEDVLAILRSGDKFETNSYVSRVFELEHALALEIRPAVAEMTGAEKGFTRAVTTKPTDGSAARQFLLVTTTPRQMEYIAGAVEELDVPFIVNNSGTARRSVRLKHRLASDLAVILRATRLSPTGKAVADDLTNTLYYDDTQYVAGEVDKYVSFFDVPTPQVEFDVRIIEIREENSGKLGLDWDAWKSMVGGQIGLTATSLEGGESFARVDTLLSLDANVLAAFLNYTVQTGTARLAQRSRLNASNLQPAVISDARHVPVYGYQRSTRDPKILTEANPRVDAGNVYDDNEAASPRTVTIVPPVENRLVDLSDDEAGLLIAIRPVIGTETVSANINVSMNTVTGFDDQGRPLLSRQSLENLFTLHDGKELLLGTLEREMATRQRRGIPLLMSVPVLKYLVSVEATSRQKSRLFLLATPRFSSVRYGAPTMAASESEGLLNITDRPVELEDGVTANTIEDLRN